METRKSGNLGTSARFSAGFWPPRFSPRSKNLGGQNPVENLAEISVKFLHGVHICGRCVNDVAFAVRGDVLSASWFLVIVVFSASDEF